MAKKLDVALNILAPLLTPARIAQINQWVQEPPFEETRLYLDSLPLSEALWWFIENVTEDNEHRSALFFHLRERVRLARG